MYAKPPVPVRSAPEPVSPLATALTELDVPHSGNPQKEVHAE
jgi:hypothetical protein